MYSRVVTVSVSKLSTDYAPVIPCASLATKRCRPRPAIHAPTHAHRVTLCPLSHMPLTGLSRLLLRLALESSPPRSPRRRRAAQHTQPPRTHLHALIWTHAAAATLLGRHLRLRPRRRGSRHHHHLLCGTGLTTGKLRCVAVSAVTHVLVCTTVRTPLISRHSSGTLRSE